MKKKNRPVNEFACPMCGVEVYANANGCHSCGADDLQSWRKDPFAADHYPDTQDKDADFDFDKFLEDEFGNKPKEANGKRVVLSILGLILLMAAVSIAVFLWVPVPGSN